MDSLCSDTHLNSPLSQTLLKEALDLAKKGGTPRNGSVSGLSEHIVRLCKAVRVPLENNWNFFPQELGGRMMSLATITPVSSSSLIDIKKFWSGFESYGPDSLSKVLDEEDVFRVRECIKSVSNPSENPYGCQLYNLRRFLEGGVCLTSCPSSLVSEEKLNSWGEWTFIDPDDHTLGVKGKFGTVHDYILVYVTKRAMIIFDMTKWYLATRNHFLMLADLISQRQILWMASKIGQILERSNYPLPEDLWKLFNLGDQIVETWKNDGYKTLSLWEALCIGEILGRKEDPAVDSKEFSRKMRDEFINSQNPQDTDHLKILHDDVIKPWISGLDSLSVFQLFGLYRIWGHPTIDELLGVKKLRSIACRPRATNPEVIKMITWKWREYFSLNYYQSHKKWPQLSILESAPKTALLSALKDGVPITPYSPGYQLSDWRYVKFEKTFEIPEKFELSEMISDKALSLNKPELIKSCQETGTIGSSHKRNVILQWLETNYNNPAEFLQKINDHGFDEKETVVGVHPKERELKIFARLFGLLTIEKRLYVVVTEAMIADHLFRYFPEITMTFDSVTLQTRIHANTSQLGLKKDMHSVVVNMDFNKWNSYMREEETLPLFRDFDHLFGLTNVFQRTHEMFKNAIMYLADGTITPFDTLGNLIKSEGTWTDHLGGIEGLRQKGWTIFTVVILRYVAEMEGHKCQIMGQGDNQVLIIHYIPSPINQDLKQRHSQFLETLNNTLKLIGPPLKLEETWSSSFFFIYGKFPVLNGKPMSMSMKRLCRIMRLTNEGFQNLESTLSSITANAAAATASDYDPTIPFIIASVETLAAIELHLRCPFYLKSSFKISGGSYFRIPVDKISLRIPLHLDEYSKESVNRRSVSFLVSIALLPCVLGGLPSVQLCDLMNHGFPDPVSLNIWSLQHLRKRLNERNPKLAARLSQMMSPEYMKSVNCEMLCQDPVSLNLLKSSSGSEKIKRMVFEFLTNGIEVKNQQFILFLQLAKERQSDLSTLLGTMNPLNPRVANSLLSSTIVGRAMQIVSKVNKTSTLIGLMLKFKKKATLAAMENLDMELDSLDTFTQFVKMEDLYGKFERNYINSVIHMACRKREIHSFVSESSFCSTSYAQILRVESWRLPITGVTVAVPQELFSVYPSHGESCTSQGHPNQEAGYILVRTSLSPGDWMQDNYDPLKLPLGLFKPFFGSATKNRVQYEGGELKQHAPNILKGILDSLCLIGWGTDYASNLSKLIKAIFSSFTDLDPEIIIPDLGTISGSVEHRWQDMRTSHYSSLSILYELLTHITVTTNYFEPQNVLEDVISDNYNISFQTVFTWIGCIFSSKILHDRIRSPSFHLHLSCKSCVKPIYEGMLEVGPVTELVEKITSTAQINNPYCWVSKEHLLGGIKSEIAFLYPIQSYKEVDESLEDLFIDASVDHYLKQFPISISGNVMNTKITESSSVLPIGVALQLPIYDFMLSLVLNSVFHYIYLRAGQIINRSYTHYQELQEEVQETLMLMPSRWFRGLTPLLLNHKSLLNLLSIFPSLSLPVGTPPSEKEKENFLSEIWKVLLIRRISAGSLLTWIDSVLSRKFFLVSSNIVMHPVILSAMRTVIGSSNESYRTSLGVISLVRKTVISVRGDHVLTSNSDFYNLTETICHGHKNSIYLPKLKSLFIKMRQRKLIGIKGVVDCLGKELKGRRTKVSEVTMTANEENPYEVPLIMLNKLTKASTMILGIDCGNKQVSNTHLKVPKDTFLLPAADLSNHFYKLDSPLTTASYKPLSVLQDIQDHVPLKGSPDEVIACLGDGVGGYTATFGRIFPQCKLIYNTLFETAKLSSVGVDNYIPAAIGMIPSVFKRVLNIKQTVEGYSDLTSPEWVRAASSHSKRLNLVICDAEGGGWENPRKVISMLTNIIQFIRLIKGKMLIFKTYASRPDVLAAILMILSGVFRNMRLYRSHFSTRFNTELFIVAWNPDFLEMHLSVSFSEDNSEMEIIGQTRVPYLLTQLRGKFTENLSVFATSCSKVSEVYSLQLRIPRWRMDLDSLMIEKTALICHQGESKNFPEALIYKWRKELNLIRYSTLNISHLKFNFLTKGVKSMLVYDYLLYVSYLIPDINHQDHDKKMGQWMNLLVKGFFHTYATVDGSWSAHINFTTRRANNGNSTCDLISTLLSTASIKRLIREAGRLNQLKNEININWGVCTLTHPFKKFADEVPEWWKHTPSLVIKLGLSPIRSYVWVNKERLEPNPIILDFPTSILEWTESMINEVPSNQFDAFSRYIRVKKEGGDVSLDKYYKYIIINRSHLTTRNTIRRLNVEID